MNEFKIGDLVSIEPYATVTGAYNKVTGNIRVTFPNGADLYISPNLVLPVPQPEGVEQ